jgi:hypothetical protein
VSFLAQVVQLPKTICGNEGVLECSGLTELWMARERIDGKNPKRCQATAVQETRIRSEFFDSNFKFQVSAFSLATKPSTLDSRLSTQSPFLHNIPTAGFRLIP